MAGEREHLDDPMPLGKVVREALGLRAGGEQTESSAVPEQGSAPVEEMMPADERAAKEPTFAEAVAAVEAARVHLNELRSGEGPVAEVVQARAVLVRAAKEAIRLGQTDPGLGARELMERRRSLLLQYGDDAGLVRRS